MDNQRGEWWGVWGRCVPASQISAASASNQSAISANSPQLLWTHLFHWSDPLFFKEKRDGKGETEGGGWGEEKKRGECKDWIIWVQQHRSLLLGGVSTALFGAWLGGLLWKYANNVKLPYPLEATFICLSTAPTVINFASGAEAIELRET